MKIWGCLFIALLLPLTSFAEVTLVELQHRVASDLLTPVRELLDEGEKIQAAGHHLILIAEGESLQAAEQLITLLDRPLVNLQIRVRQVSELQQVGKDNSAAIHYGNKAGLSTSAEVGFSRSNSTTNQEQTLSLVEGSRGLIEVGKEIPYTEQWAAMTGDTSGYAENIAYKNIATGFWVSPVQIQGDKVLVDVEPYISNAGATTNGDAPQINYSQLRSRLLVPLAQWYPLGSQLQQGDKISRAIISWHSNNGQADRQLQIRIEAMD